MQPLHRKNFMSNWLCKIFKRSNSRMFECPSVTFVSYTIFPISLSIGNLSTHVWPKEITIGNVNLKRFLLRGEFFTSRKTRWLCDVNSTYRDLVRGLKCHLWNGSIGSTLRAMRCTPLSKIISPELSRFLLSSGGWISGFDRRMYRLYVICRVSIFRILEICRDEDTTNTANLSLSLPLFFC